MQLAPTSHMLGGLASGVLLCIPKSVRAECSDAQINSKCVRHIIGEAFAAL